MEKDLKDRCIYVKGNGNQIGRDLIEPDRKKNRGLLLGLGFAIGLICSCIIYLIAVLFCE